MAVLPGDPAPVFHARCSSNPRFAFDTVAGRYLVLAFVGSGQEPAFQTVIQNLAAAAAFDDTLASLFLVTTDPDGAKPNHLPLRIPGVEDEKLTSVLQDRFRRRVVPEIRKAFQFEVTRMERYLVACYAAEEGGHFRAHRDNTTKGTAHRRFAVSVNLNADEYEGGDLRLPEFGPRTYRAPTGGGVVFSCSLLHEAIPVTRGKRYAFLPFLYDEAARKIREANLHHLEAPAASPSG
jgi:hypothetical protein